ncbi:hypothetical protein CC86DRAFT_469652 [Ophiobolus disseminans]|uniref:Chitin-binding type-1 domain-containing protein n=1 Tax=Ophiobolus disseminans TaxID=1469910 RepID=A0A6A6ZPP9_9PLEO|nr:hypothetical protein CC86DRAFT_469652 [Ophiobolus disseminans]
MRHSLLFAVLAVVSTCAAQFDPQQCGPTAGNQKCPQNKCCSAYGWCGNSDAYCRATRGCQSGYGRCVGASSPSASRAAGVVVASPIPASPISNNARCGSTFGGKTCKGSAYGDCCSQYKFLVWQHFRPLQGLSRVSVTLWYLLWYDQQHLIFWHEFANHGPKLFEQCAFVSLPKCIR